MSFNSNWPRWIAGSIYKHFITNKGSYTLFVEGQERKTNLLSDFLELQWDGPDIDLYPSDEYNAEIEICVRVFTTIGRDIYLIDKMVGQAMVGFTKTIPVYEIEDSPGTQIGCLQLISGTLRTHRYGVERPDNKILQSTVEARYKIDL